MNKGEIPRRAARLALPRTNHSAPKVSAVSPAARMTTMLISGQRLDPRGTGGSARLNLIVRRFYRQIHACEYK